MSSELKTIKGQIRQRWFGDLEHWLNGGSMQGHLIYTNDLAIDCNAFLKRLFKETLEYLQRNEFKRKCRPAYISVAQASQLKTEADVKSYLSDAVASPEILRGGDALQNSDYRSLFFIENLDALISRVDNVAELKRLGRHEWTGLQSHFKEASDTGRFNVVITVADLKNSVFVDGRAGPYLIYYMHELKR